MFRRRWSSLPADPVFPSNLTDLGYCIVNDEIRSIENTDYYFKYFSYKNERWNERQRFAFNEAVCRIIREHLTTDLGLRSVPLPLGTPTTSPHVPILVSPSLQDASRVVLIFGESAQELGVISHRVIGRAGGIAKGSMISLVPGLRAQRASAAADDDGGDGASHPPGVVLANCGELWWWPEGGKGLTPQARHGVPMASCVLLGRYHERERNEIEGNRTVWEHVRCVFESVLLGGLAKDGVKVDVIAVGDAADEVEAYLNDDEVWERVGKMMSCLVVVGGMYSSAEFKCEGFAKFMDERARAYVIHNTPVGTPIAGSGGNPRAVGFTSFGCPVYSAGPAAAMTELMLIEVQSSVLQWIQEVATAGEAYKNDVIEVYVDEVQEVDDTWGDYQSDPGKEDDKGEATAADGAVKKKGEKSEKELGPGARDAQGSGHVTGLDKGVQHLELDDSGGGGNDKA
ncbi:hypothetical protein VTK26DRAFT_588 [Humicola hyalothermophila]